MGVITVITDGVGLTQHFRMDANRYIYDIESFWFGSRPYSRSFDTSALQSRHSRISFAWISSLSSIVCTPISNCAVTPPGYPQMVIRVPHSVHTYVFRSLGTLIIFNPQCCNPIGCSMFLGPPNRMCCRLYLYSYSVRRIKSRRVFSRSTF